jgi:hypothetical protein
MDVIVLNFEFTLQEFSKGSSFKVIKDKVDEAFGFIAAMNFYHIIMVEDSKRFKLLNDMFLKK